MSAQQLLDNPYFDKVLTDLTSDITQDWQSAKTLEDREALHRELKSIEKIHTWIINQASSDAKLKAV